MSRQRRPTSADVAEKAGVSRTTVSFVLNNTPNQTIPEHTRALVLQAARALNYSPSAAARTLRSGRSEVAVFLLPEWLPSYEMEQYLERLSAILAEHGLISVFVHAHSLDMPIEQLWQSISPAVVVPFYELPPAAVRSVDAQNVPLVPALFYDTEHRGPTSTLQHDIGALQAEHLLARGHTHIAYAAPVDPREEGFYRARLDALTSVLSRRRLTAPAVFHLDLAPENAAHALDEMLSAAPGVTAVCAFNDNHALAVIAGAHLLNLSIPNDLAVIGADDIPAGRLITPALTTIGLDLDREAADLAHRVLDASAKPNTMSAAPGTSTYLIPRDTT